LVTESVVVKSLFVQQCFRDIVEGKIPSDNMEALLEGRARGVQQLKEEAMGRAIFEYSDEEVIKITTITDGLMLLQQIEILELLKSLYNGREMSEQIESRIAHDVLFQEAKRH